MSMNPASDTRSIAATGVLAAELLEAACDRETASADLPRVELVRDLAKDLKDQLEALAHFTSPSLMAEAALRCADLANLAACNLDGLSVEHRPTAVASAHVASGAARALSALAGSPASESEASHPGNVLRDTREAAWRADLAVRQVVELSEAATED